MFVCGVKGSLAPTPADFIANERDRLSPDAQAAVLQFGLVQAAALRHPDPAEWLGLTADELKRFIEHGKLPQHRPQLILPEEHRPSCPSGTHVITARALLGMLAWALGCASEDPELVFRMHNGAQSALAERLDISRQFVSQIINGGRALPPRVRDEIKKATRVS